MASAFVSSSRVLLSDGAFHRACVEIRDGHIRSVTAVGADEKVTTEHMVVPGFVDLQVNGIDDVDVWKTAHDGDQRAWDRLENLLLDQGVTSWCPTLVSAPLKRYRTAMDSIRRWKAGSSFAPNIIGIHLEGPFLGTAHGAHRGEFVRDPDLSWLETNLDDVVLMTMGAESPHASEACALAISRSTNVAIGHSRPTLKQFDDMVATGASLVTHLFNAMSGLHHRQPGLAAWALLEPKLCASIIADGVHVSSELVSLSFAAKSDGMILVTDSVAWRSGIAGEITMSVIDGVARLADGTLAGSTVTMPDAIKFCVRQADVPLPMVLQAATATPSRLLRQNDRGVIMSGCRADITALTDDLDVAAVWVAGQQVR